MLKSIIKKIIPSHQTAVAFQVSPEQAAYDAMSTVRALERIASRGIKINSVIDIGASDGRWSVDAMRVFPESHYLLVEAQQGHLVALRSLSEKKTNVEYVLAAAGDEEGEVFFDDSELFGGIACKERGRDAKKAVPMVTVDAEISRRKLNGPYLVKLDTHGFEVPILNGALDTLKSANLVVIETYGFQIAPGSLLFYEMCAFMEKLGFGVVDISEPLWRKHDRAIWQFDLFFVPLNNPIFSHKTYI